MEGAEPVLQIVSSLGVAAVLGWYLYYTTTVSFPKMNDNMVARMDVLAEHQNETIKTVCADFTQCLREERELRIKEVRGVREQLQYLNSQKDS